MNWLFTGLSTVAVIAAGISVWAALTAERIHRSLRHMSEALEGLGEAHDELFAEVDKLRKRHNENLGRIGALKAKLNSNDAPPADGVDSERAQLERELARRTHG